VLASAKKKRTPWPKMGRTRPAAHCVRLLHSRAVRLEGAITGRFGSCERRSRLKGARPRSTTFDNTSWSAGRKRYELTRQALFARSSAGAAVMHLKMILDDLERSQQNP
jgi:hypothetical protein